MVGNTEPRTVGGPDRAQSVFDFSIGVSVFLVVVLGVLVFVPTAFSGLGGGSTGSSGDPLAAERGVTYLTQTAFVSGGSPTGLDIGCTLLFFTGTTGNPDVPAPGPSPLGAPESTADCGFDKNSPLAMKLTLDSTHQINVTIERDIDGDSKREVLCWREASNSLVKATTCSAGTGDVKLRAGPDAVNNGNLVVATRYATLGGKGVYIVVRTW